MTEPLAHIVARLDDRGTIVYQGSLAECELWIARQPAPGEYQILAIGLPTLPMDTSAFRLSLKVEDDEEGDTP